MVSYMNGLERDADSGGCRRGDQEELGSADLSSKCLDVSLMSDD
jgi:hypothetical protein